ncbi:MAG TPA: hypothetical protein VFT22_33840 [Kofleriaceae bacterium]|nr:hypothetical protein [Kofleriaceae bacterium]
MQAGTTEPVALREQLLVIGLELVDRDPDRCAGGRIAMVLAEVQLALVARDAHVERCARLEAMLEVDREHAPV